MFLSNSAFLKLTLYSVHHEACSKPSFHDMTVTTKKDFELRSFVNMIFFYKNWSKKGFKCLQLDTFSFKQRIPGCNLSHINLGWQRRGSLLNAVDSTEKQFQILYGLVSFKCILTLPAQTYFSTGGMCPTTSYISVVFHPICMKFGENIDAFSYLIIELIIQKRNEVKH